ncbi:MAG: PD40 domain-containing protein [Bacteroidales bacterium]|nr:PD40 domain-containing protein [Bacteroidales bacterium]
MKRNSLIIRNLVFILFSTSIFISTGCNKPRQIKYKYGTFPDTAYNLDAINTEYDDYNSDLDWVGTSFAIIFSSNRTTSGGKFDFVTGALSFGFERYEGYFSIESDMIDDFFLTGLTEAANTEGDDFGPFRFVSTLDAYEYFLYTSEGPGGDLDIMYLKYLPQLGSIIPDFGAPVPANILNSDSDDGYIAFDVSETRIFFNSDREGQFNIYTIEKPVSYNIDDWLALDPATPVKIDSINSEYDDKCPIVSRNVMVFTSNRPGGMGGFDLYYSIYKDGKWGSPVNFGPTVNSDADEYRPILGYHPDFTNLFLVFSSNRSGGKGGYDLYFAGVDIPGEPTLITK